jgi:Transposase DDE domain
VELAQMLHAVEAHLIERDIFIGAKELVPSRLVAVRMPEAIVNERRRIAKKKAKKKGYRPSQAHLKLMAWNLFISNVPSTIWKTATVVKGYPIRWQIEVL